MICTAAGGREWEADPGQALAGHEKFLDACRWRGQFAVGNSGLVTFWCEGYYVHEGTLELSGVLLDSSDRFNGITMRQRMSFHEKLMIRNAGVVMMPFASKPRHT